MLRSVFALDGSYFVFVTGNLGLPTCGHIRVCTHIVRLMIAWYDYNITYTCSNDRV